MLPESFSWGLCCSSDPAMSSLARAPLDPQNTRRMCQAWKSRMHRFVQSPLSWRRTCRKGSRHGRLEESLETLLSYKCGQALFRDFLKLEFCEENLDFWLACQEFSSFDGPEELRREAASIYEEFVRDNANRQVNLDSDTRESISQNLQQPTPSCFVAAQRRIYSLMENGSFPLSSSLSSTKSWFRFKQVDHYCTVTDLAPQRSQENNRHHDGTFSSIKNSPLLMAAH